MSLTTHLEELRRKHEDLSRQVEAETRAPGSDSLVITDLKKRKLALKQEIERLRAAPAH